MKKILLGVLCSFFLAGYAFANEESPKVESSKVESPKVESSKIESPKAQASKVEPSGVYLREAQLREALILLLQKEPEIIFDILDANGEQFITSITEASEKMRAIKVEAQWEKDLAIPKKYKTKYRPTLGNENAPYTIVAYSDFLCTYCLQGAKTIEELYKSDPENIRIIFKSNPANDVSRHASRWFYVAFRKDPKKAWLLHDAIFANQKAYASDPMTTIKNFANEIGLDADAMEVEVAANIPEIDTIINEDVLEAQNMGFKGTPYFLLNDIVIRGALPKSQFEKAFLLLKKNKKSN